MSICANTAYILGAEGLLCPERKSLLSKKCDTCLGKHYCLSWQVHFAFLPSLLLSRGCLDIATRMRWKKGGFKNKMNNCKCIIAFVIFQLTKRNLMVQSVLDHMVFKSI